MGIIFPMLIQFLFELFPEKKKKNQNLFHELNNILLHHYAVKVYLNLVNTEGG